MFCCPACAPNGGRFVCAPEGTAIATPPAAAAKPAAAGALAGQRWIDIHCHLFNILDLPALQFITRTRLTMPPPVQVPAVILVAILVGGLNQMALTAEAELKALDDGQDFRLLARPGAAGLATEDAVRILAGREAPEAAGTLAASPLGHLFHPPGASTHRRPPRPDGGDLAVRRAANELFPGRDPDAAASDAEIASIAQRLDARLLGEAGAFLAWANGMARPRNVLTGELLGQFPEGSDVLLTPAMVDYSR